MRYLLLALSVAVFFCSYLAELKVLPPLARFLPELLSVIVVLYVFVAGIQQRFRFMGPPYWFAFGALAIIMLCGAVANSVSAGPLLGGLRFYLRAIPLFFLPAVFEFDERQLLQQMRFVLAVALLQVPIAIWQRYHIYASNKYSGDNVFGTVMISGNLSIFLIGVTCVLAGMYLRKRLALPAFALLFFVLLLPTTIDETKATIFLLPLGLIAALMIGSAPGRRLRTGLTAAALLAGFAAIFVPIYDYFNVTNNPEGFTIEKFFTDKKLGGRYLDAGAGLGTRKEAGRIDSLVIPLGELSKDPVHLAFGFGMGNASRSSLGPAFAGEYAPLFSRYAIESSAATFLLEIGVCGTVLVLILHWLILRDSLLMAREDGTVLGSLAIGWAAITIVMTVSIFYLAMHIFESASYLFWYFSGVIAAGRMRRSVHA